MREKFRFLVIALTLFSTLPLLAPVQARADVLSSGTGGVTPPPPLNSNPPLSPPPTAPPESQGTSCPGASSNTNSLDNDARTNNAAHTQYLFIAAHNANTQFPLLPAMNQCMKNLMSFFQQLPSLSDPLNIANAIFSALISNIITNIIGQVCQSILGDLTAIKQMVTNMASICLPIPNLSFGLPAFSQNSCSGGSFSIGLPSLGIGWSMPGSGSGTQYNLLTGAVGTGATPAGYNYNPYLNKSQ
jgi:hypothetical protein